MDNEIFIVPIGRPRNNITRIVEQICVIIRKSVGTRRAKSKPDEKLTCKDRLNAASSTGAQAATADNKKPGFKSTQTTQ